MSRTPDPSLQFVWFQGRCWRLDLWQGRDHRGNVSLTSLRDHSCGVCAPEEKLVPCSAEETEAILWFLKNSV